MGRGKRKGELKPPLFLFCLLCSQIQTQYFTRASAEEACSAASANCVGLSDAKCDGAGFLLCDVKPTQNSTISCFYEKPAGARACACANPMRDDNATVRIHG